MSLNRFKMIKYIYEQCRCVIESFFIPDFDVMSNDCKRTLANPISKDNYRKCIKDMDINNKKIGVFIDHDGKKVTILKN